MTVAGYFDHIKAEKARPMTVVPSDNVVQLRDGLHPYAQGIRKAWLGRLDDLPRPWFKGAAWDNNCFVTARKLIELANSVWSGYSLADARADYFEHAPYDHAWDEREKCWDQALDKAGAAALAEPDPLAGIPDVTTIDFAAEMASGDPARDVDVSAIIREKFPLLDWHDLWNTEDEDEEWIVEPILPARRLVALFSAPKVGKSLLMLEIAVAVARGQEVLGVTPDRPRRVLYVDFENDPRGDVRERLRAMGIRPDHLENLCYLSYPTLAKLDTPTGALELMAIVSEYECEVVVIDTISRAVAGEENENDTWLSFYRNTGLAMKQAGVACIRLDHTGKDHDKGMRGGSAKYGDVDAVWKLTKVTEDTYRLDCTDHRMRIAEPTIVVTREQSPFLRHKVEAEGRMAAWDAKVRELVTALDAMDLPNDAGRDTARKALKERGLRGSDASLSQAIKLRKQRLGYSSEEAEL